MPFTFADVNQANPLQTYDLQVSIDPAAGIIDQVFDSGTEAAGTIAVVNTGAVNAQLFLTADWGPTAPTTATEGTLLANALAVSVTISSDAEAVAASTVFTGRLIDLIDTNIFDSLGPGNQVDVAISVVMPDTHSGPALLSKAINTDFVFVAVSVA